MYLSKLILRLARLLMKLFSGYALTGFPKIIPEKCSDDDTESEDAASAGQAPVSAFCRVTLLGEVTTAQDTAAIKVSKCPWS